MRPPPHKTAGARGGNVSTLPSPVVQHTQATTKVSDLNTSSHQKSEIWTWYTKGWKRDGQY